MIEYLPNSEFDLSLQEGSAVPDAGGDAYAQEMAWHFLLAAAPGDSVIVHRPVPEGFLSYLDTKGIRLPAAVLHPAFTGEAEFVPFGWNARAVSLAERYARPPIRPGLDTVRKANSRSFALELEQRWRGEECRGRLFGQLSGLRGFLETRPVAESWVAKGEHGFAGTANRRVPGGPLSAQDEARLAPLFRNGNRVVAEPWDERIQDLAILFRVTEAGAAEDIRGHTLLNSRDGAFLGVEIAPDRLPPEPWRGQLAAAAGTLALALHALGYSGPVGMDAYAYRTEAGPRLRPWVDVNARLSMALPAHGLARRLPGRYIRWSWHKPRKLRYPSGYAELDHRLGPAAFDPKAGEGILAVSPLFREDAREDAATGPGRRIAAGRNGDHASSAQEPPGESQGPAAPLVRPKRAGFALVARSPAMLEHLQAEFIRILRRSP